MVDLYITYLGSCWLPGYDLYLTLGLRADSRGSPDIDEETLPYYQRKGTERRKELGKSAKKVSKY